MKMKRAILTVAFVTYSALVMAGGAAGQIAHTGTNNWSYTHTGTTPIYLDRIDIRCNTPNTATVETVNYTGITNTLLTCASTNTIIEYVPATPTIRLDKGGVIRFNFESAFTTNLIDVGAFQK